MKVRGKSALGKETTRTKCLEQGKSVVRMRSVVRMAGGEQAGSDPAGLSAEWDVKHKETEKAYHQAYTVERLTWLWEKRGRTSVSCVR